MAANRSAPLLQTMEYNILYVTTGNGLCHIASNFRGITIFINIFEKKPTFVGQPFMQGSRKGEAMVPLKHQASP